MKPLALLLLCALAGCGKLATAPETACRTQAHTYPVLNAKGDTLSLTTVSSRVCQ